MFKARLCGRWEPARDTFTFELDIGKRNFSFKPGQYAALTLKNAPYADEKGTTRALSIASSPRDEKLLFATRLSSSAFKKSLAEAALGSEFEIDGPFGTFTVENDSRPAVFLAGGIGITLFRSVIKDAIENKRPQKITLFYFNRDPQAAVFLDDPKQWEKENRSFKVFNVFGGLDEIKTALSQAADFKKVIFYTAGPAGFVQTVYAFLKEKNVLESNIRTEEFPGY